MADSGIKDTTAYKIIRQMTDHIYGSDEKYEDSDIVAICRLFGKRQGSWEALMGGSMDDAVRLEDAIGSVIKYRRGEIVAAKIATSLANRVR